MTSPGAAYVSTAYKISKGADRFGRRWQAEVDGDHGGGCQFARRAYTPSGAVRLMRHDLDVLVTTGHRSLAQWRKVWWKRTRCRLGWHRWYDLRAGRACLSCGKPASGDPEPS